MAIQSDYQAIKDGHQINCNILCRISEAALWTVKVTLWDDPKFIQTLRSI